jgi:hypothetical protein
MKVQVSYGADLQDVPSITYGLTSEVADSLEVLATILRESQGELVTEEYNLENLQLFAQRAGTVQADLARLSDRLTDCYKLIRGYYQVIETPPEPEPESVETLDMEEEQLSPEVSGEDGPAEDGDV